jgi:hypothetical protein
LVANDRWVIAHRREGQESAEDDDTFTRRIVDDDRHRVAVTKEHDTFPAHVSQRRSRRDLVVRAELRSLERLSRNRLESEGFDPERSRLDSPKDSLMSLGRSALQCRAGIVVLVAMDLDGCAQRDPAPHDSDANAPLLARGAPVANAQTRYPQTCNGAAVLSNPRKFPDSGPCDESTPIRTSPDAGQAICRYTVSCDPQPLAKRGCDGLPNDVWGANALRRCAARVRYPVGCVVTLPTANPYYAGHAQACSCSDLLSQTDAPHWLCGL